ATIVESTAKEEKVLQAKRSACAAKIDERTLSAYERIRGNAHNHLAVVTLFPKNADGTYGDACGGCFHTITPQRILDIASGKKLVICEHCGRIIVNPEI
ncbi:MAG: C4-type zinc ribbon domain-containing protein, partial [Bacteroidales bacterium]|nr:C4-type zinc ribbon domain-containing protein [Bacteroidales bacterium]